MATETEQLVVSLEARVTQFEKAFTRANRTASTNWNAIERRGQLATVRIERSMLAASTAVRRFGSIAGTVGLGAGVLGGAGLIKFADTFTRINNTLKVAGLQGEEVGKTFNRLFAVAQRNGTAIEPLVTLYSRLAGAQKELGASSDDLERFTEGVSLALKVQGGDATSAAGALLQLSQALGGSIVRAEEFNSMLDGARPLLQSVADGLVEAGGSVSKLRQLVNDGKVSSAAFFNAFLAGMGDLKAQAATTTSTLGENFNRLTNSLTVLVGSLDRVAGASVGAGSGIGALSSAIDGLASDEDKLRTIVELVERLAGAWAGAKIGRLAGGYGALVGAGIGAFAPELLGLGEAEDALVSLNREADQLRATLDALPSDPTGDPVIDAQRLAATEAALASVTAKARELTRLRAMLKAPSGEAPSAASTSSTVKPVALADFPAIGSGKTSGSGDRDAENRRIMETIADLEFEAAQLKRNAVEREINNRLRAAGVSIMSQEGQRIAELVRGNEAAAAAMRGVEEAQERIADASRQLAETAVSALDRVIVQGEKLKDVLGDLARQLASSVLRSILIGPAGTAGTGIAGTLFGGARASGGPVSSGRAYLVGERGPELMIPKSPGSIVPNHKLGGGSVSINSPITINVEGGSRGAEADRELADRVSSQLRNAVQQVFAAELGRQMRPGGILNT